MALSRLRLRLAAGFAFAFLLALAILATVALGYLWNESTRRLDKRLDASADAVAARGGRVLQDSPASPPALAAEAVGREWPPCVDRFVFVDDAGTMVAGVGPRDVIDRTLRAWAVARSAHFDVDKPGDDYRASGLGATLPRVAGPRLRF